MNERRTPSFESEAVGPLRFTPARGAPADARARVRERVGESIVSLGTLGGSAPLPNVPRRSGVTRGPTRRPLSRPVSIGVTAFVVGGLVGAGLYARLAPVPAERVIFVDRVVEAPSWVAPSASPQPVSPDPIVQGATDPVVRSGGGRERVSAASSPTVPSRGLRAERALLDEARRSLGNGAYVDVLPTLERHAQRFPDGLLSEEREALAIKALALLGRKEDARARAESFEQRYPNSLFGTAVAEVLDAIR